MPALRCAACGRPRACGPGPTIRAAGVRAVARRSRWRPSADWRGVPLLRGPRLRVRRAAAPSPPGPDAADGDRRGDARRQPRRPRRRGAVEPRASGLQHHARRARDRDSARRRRSALRRWWSPATACPRLRRPPLRRRRGHGRTGDHHRRAGAGRRLRAVPAADQHSADRGLCARAARRRSAGQGRARGRWPPARRTPVAASATNELETLVAAGRARRGGARAGAHARAARARRSTSGVEAMAAARRHARRLHRRRTRRRSCASRSAGGPAHAARRRRRSAELEFAARLHDVGKIGVPDAVLRKEGPLDERGVGDHAPAPGLGSADAAPDARAQRECRASCVMPTSAGTAMDIPIACAARTSRSRAASSSRATPTTR